MEGRGSNWDIEATGLPQIVCHDYIELEMIQAISKFRSCAGHEYRDDFEAGCSMKHYFRPKESIDWTKIAISAPVAGQVVSISQELLPNSGQQVLIQSSEYPAFIFCLFHVEPGPFLKVGEDLVPGQIIGHHVGRITCSDVAVKCLTSAGKRNVSYFELLTDSVFDGYRIRGIASRSQMIINPEHRRANPCTFAEDNPGDWVVLR
jgi:hypothetical protein